MSWLHQCRLPGRFNIWVRRGRPEAQYACACGRTYTLERRVVEGTGYGFWRWAPTEERNTSDEYRESDTFSDTQVWPHEIRDDSERRIPDIRMGFQRE